jgi:hypothetical protein
LPRKADETSHPDDSLSGGATCATTKVLVTMNLTQKSYGTGRTAVLARRTGAFVGAAALVFALSACSGDGMDDYAGIYTGDSGRTTLQLKDDGTAVITQEGLKQRPDENGTSTWQLEDGTLTVVENNVWDYDIYATTDDASESLFFMSDDDSWGNELYTRVSN